MIHGLLGPYQSPRLKSFQIFPLLIFKTSTFVIWLYPFAIEIFFQHFQTICQLGYPHRFPPTDFLQRVLIDATAYEFSLGNFCNLRELLVIRHSISFWLVMDSFEFQQTQIVTFLPMSVRFLSNLDRRPICEDVRSL